MGSTKGVDDNSTIRRPITGSQDPRPASTAAGAAPAGVALNPSVQDIYWREAHTREPYYKTGYTYEDYAPAYRTGYDAASRNMGRKTRFDDLEIEMAQQYEHIKGKSRLAWEDAKLAARAAWDRIERLMPGDLDNDGR